MKKFELTPTNGRKSFNGKCRVEQSGGISTLLSYNTKVAQYNHSENVISLSNNPKHFSNTTCTHINAFIELYGFDKMTKKEMLNYNK